MATTYKAKQRDANLWVVVDGSGYVVRDSDSRMNRLPNSMRPEQFFSTEEEARVEAARLEQVEQDIAKAEEQRIADYYAEKKRRAEREAESARRQRIVNQAGAYAKNVQLKLADAYSSKQIISDLIQKWESDLKLKAAELRATEAQIEILEAEAERIYQEKVKAENELARANGEV